MYLITRIDRNTGAQRDWLVEVSLNAELIHMTRTRQKARRFRSEADAWAVRNRLETIEPRENWKVVQA